MKESNDMPELKAGMIVELVTGDLYICLPSGDDVLLYDKDLKGGNRDYQDIISIYTKNLGLSYAFVLNKGEYSRSLNLIWSKPNSKIEEIEQTILKPQQVVKELKGENK